MLSEPILIMLQISTCAFDFRNDSWSSFYFSKILGKFFSHFWWLSQTVWYSLSSWSYRVGTSYHMVSIGTSEKSPKFLLFCNIFHSLFNVKITVGVTKSSHQDCGLCYLHLPIFFLYTHTHTTPVLLHNKKFLCSPSQIVCTVTTMNVTCTQATLCVHENLCMALILLC